MMANLYFVGKDASAPTDPSKPLNWSTTSGGSGGTVAPTRNDALYFDRNSPACAFLADMEIGEFYSVSGFAATINLGSSTITNYGHVDFRNVTASQLISQNATWIQNGGTDASPNIWNMGRQSYADRMRFGRLTFAEGSVTQLGEPAAVVGYYFGCVMIIDGRILAGRTNIVLTNNAITLTGTTFRVGDNGFIAPEILTLTLTNNAGVAGNFNNVKPVNLNISASAVTASGVIDSNLTLSSDTNSGLGATFAGDMTASRSVSLIASNTRPTVHDLTGLTCCGDVSSTTPTGGSVSAVGTLKLAGSNDQVINCGSLAAAVDLAVNKPVGKAGFLSGNFALTTGEHNFGDVTFDNFSGSFTGGANTINTRDWVFKGTTGGVVNASGTTLNVSGEYDLTGTTLTGYVTSNAAATPTTLNMRANAAGNAMRRQMMLCVTGQQRRYYRVNIDAGAIVQWTGHYYPLVLYANFAGDMDIAAGVNTQGIPSWSSAIGNVYNFESTAKITGARFGVRFATITGDLTTIQSSRLYVFYASTIDGKLNPSTPLYVERQPDSARTFYFTSLAKIHDLVVEAASNFTTTLNFAPGSEIRGNVSGVAAVGPTVITGPLRLTGDKAQTIDLSAVI